jgi:hypothetical protein
MKCHILKPKESSKKTVVADGTKASPLNRGLITPTYNNFFGIPKDALAPIYFKYFVN